MRDRADVAWHASMNAAVERIPDDWMPDRAQMHADLVRSAGVNGNARQRYRRIEMFRPDDARHRLTASPRPCRHFLAIARIAADRCIDTPARLHDSPNQR